MTEDLLRQTYAAFNAHDIDGALALMHPDVDWPNGMEGGREHGHAEVRAYWERQFAAVDSQADPEAFEELPDGRIAVTVHIHARNRDGDVAWDDRVRHVHELRDGLIARMDIEP